MGKPSKQRAHCRRSGEKSVESRKRQKYLKEQQDSAVFKQTQLIELITEGVISMNRTVENCVFDLDHPAVIKGIIKVWTG